MNELIKDIIDYLGNDENYNCDSNDESYYLKLSYREAHELMYFITNLQEENRKQDEILKWYVHQNKENIELIMDLFKEIEEFRLKESE